MYQMGIFLSRMFLPGLNCHNILVHSNAKVSLFLTTAEHACIILNAFDMNGKLSSSLETCTWILCLFFKSSCCE